MFIILSVTVCFVICSVGIVTCLHDLQDNRPTGTIPLAGNKIIRHPDDPKQHQGFKFEIQCEYVSYCIAGNFRSVLFSLRRAPKRKFNPRKSRQ